MAEDNDQKSGGLKSVMEALPLDRLKDELQDGLKALGEKGLDSVKERITGATDSLEGIADSGGVIGKAAKEGTKSAAQGDNPIGGALKGGLGGVKDKVKDALPGGGGGGANKGGKATKCTNIIEEIDVGVPINVAYNQWTQFQDFSDFMKKVDSVDEQEDENITFKAQVFWSHRTWEATVIDQVPNERIIWKSKGAKGHVDGAVTFHELGPNLTRILVVLEYYPQGLFERTGNLWRAQGRRARLELKHFRRHVMTRAILEDEEDLEGWRGEIHDSEVERDHDEVVEEERQDQESGSDEPEDESEESEEYDDEEESEEGEPEDEYDEPEADEEESEEADDEESEDEYDEPEAEEEPEEESEEYEDEEEPEEGEPEDEYDEPEDEGVDGEESEEEYDEPEDELEDDELADEEESEEESEEPEDEEYDEAEEEEPEEEPEEEESEEEPEEEPEKKPRRRSSAKKAPSKRTSTRKRR